MTPRERLFRSKGELPVCVECLRCGRRNTVSGAGSVPLTLFTQRLKCSACGSGAVRATRARTEGEVQTFLSAAVGAQTNRSRREHG